MNTVVVERRRPARLAKTGAIAFLAIVAGSALLGLLPGSLNPFRGRSIDRSPPMVLKSIADIGEFRAATANLQFMVDLEDDTRFVPSIVKGERTRLVAAGTVDAGVNLTGLPGSAIVIDDARQRVTVHLPAVELFPPKVNLDDSHVVSRDRGLLDRVGSVFTDGSDDHDVYALAERKLRDGAASDPELVARAKTNTERMLRTMISSLGYTDVVVNFAEPTVT